MKCPNCNETLAMTQRDGVEIDYCPNCRGVWLDKGELDKILERSADYYSNKDNYREDYYRKDDDYKYQQQHPKQYPYKKKKSFFSDFFDFD